MGDSLVLFKSTGHISNGFMRFPIGEDEYAQVLFQSIPENLSDARKANYEVKEVAKRLEPLLIYQSTGFREISFGLKFGARTAQEAHDLFGVANLLRNSVYPNSNGIPSICKLYLGPFFVYYKVSGGGNGVTLQLDEEKSETENGMNCVVRDYSISPSDKRLNAPELEEIGGTPDKWWEKCPAEITVSIGLYVFVDKVWGTGCMSTGG